MLLMEPSLRALIATQNSTLLELQPLHIHGVVQSQEILRLNTRHIYALVVRAFVIQQI